jgi:hypothetical protein
MRERAWMPEIHVEAPSIHPVVVVKLVGVWFESNPNQNSISARAIA